MNANYVVISPCRDEAEYMRRTLDSVANQTKLPSKWIIVDDGSTDETPDILQEYAKKHEFIEIITRENRGVRKVGPGVVDAFYTGYQHINPDDYDYICKLDLDLDLPSKYFETLISRMEKNPRIGTCSGKPYNEINGRLVSEKRGDEMSVGMTKLYRTIAFKQIGGLVREVMWDAIDCHRCRQLGWLAVSWDEPDLRFIHLRIMGSSQDNILVGRMRHGFGQYFMGTGLAYMIATCVFRAFHRPYISGGAAMLWGYLKSMLSKAKKIPDQELIEFINYYQWSCLVRGKARATALVNQRQQNRWDPSRPPLPMPISSN